MPKKNTRRREKRKKAREEAKKEAKKVLNPAKCAARPEEKNLPKMRTETGVKQSNSKLIFDAKSNVIKGKLHSSEQQNLTLQIEGIKTRKPVKTRKNCRVLTHEPLKDVQVGVKNTELKETGPKSKILMHRNGYLQGIIVSKKRSAATLTPFPKQSNDKNSTKIVNKEHSKDMQEKNHVSFRSPSNLLTKDLTNTSLKADPNKGVSKKLTASNKPTITPIKDANNDNLNSKKTSQKQKQLSNGSSRKRKHELINNTKRRYQNANDSPSEPSVPDGIAPIESTSVVEIPLSPVYDTESVELNAYEKSLLSGEVFVSSEEGPVFGYFPGMDDKPIHEIYPCQRPSTSAEEPCSCAFHLNNEKVLKKKLYNVVETSKLAAQLRRRLDTTAACAKW